MSETVIVDSSIAVKWLLHESDSDIANELLAQWRNKSVTILAPALLLYEVSNVLYQRVRRGDITSEQARLEIVGLLSSEVTWFFSQYPQLSLRAVELTHQFPATYDAHYLALAERENCEFWTADTRLWRAVRDKLEWVHTLVEEPTG